MGEIVTPTEFTKSWAATRATAVATHADEYLPIQATFQKERFEVARWSRYSADFDKGKLAHYLSVGMAEFGQSLPDMLDHTVKTGIGKIVTFREAPRYVLDPGRRWRAYQASRFGVPRSRYVDAIRGVSTVQKFLEQEQAAARKARLSDAARLEAMMEALEDMRIEFALQQQEVNHLRHEVALRPEG